MQKINFHKITHVVTDNDESLLKSGESPYIKGYRIAFNKNANTTHGSGADVSIGNNLGVGTPIQANSKACVNLLLPKGKNKCIGTREFVETNELYYFNYNSEGNHGIYRVDGRNMNCQIVYIGSCLNFQNKSKYALPPHRVEIQIKKSIDANTSQTIETKYLIFTDGYNNQRWLDVEASIATNSFDETLFPFFKLNEFNDKCELIDLAPTPPHQCPSVTVLPNNLVDNVSLITDKEFQFAYSYRYFCGRKTTLSPYSASIVVNSQQCVTDSLNPRCLEIEMYAGNPLVEKIELYFRNCNSDWVVYDVIDVYSDCSGKKFWELTNKLQNYQYSADTNTFKYKFCNDKECKITSQEDANTSQTGIPELSVAVTKVGDELVLANNLRGSKNTDCETLEKIDVIYKGATDTNCNIEYVDVVLRAVVHNIAAGLNQPIYRNNIATQDAVWGGIGNAVLGVVKYEDEVGTLYKQTIPSGKTGFRGYFEGTGIFGYSQQYHTVSGALVEVPGWNNERRNDILGSIDATNYYYQEWRFTLPKGFKGIFRIASHLEVEGENYEDTSTYTFGRLLASSYVANGASLPTSNSKEIYVDTCGGGFTSSDFIMIADPTIPEVDYVVLPKARVVVGYAKDVNNKRLERQGVSGVNGALNYLNSETTDHNGFYFAANTTGFDAVVSHYVNNGVGGCNIQAMALHKSSAKGLEVKNAVLPLVAECKYSEIKGKVIDCETGQGIKGVAVLMEHGKSTTTDSSGEFKILAHNWGIAPYSIIRRKIILNNFGKCILSNCLNGCDVCIAPYEVDVPMCLNCDIIADDYLVNPLTFEVRFLDKPKKGLKKGGRYGIGIKEFDSKGRHTYVSNLDKHYVNIPFVQEDKVFGYGSIEVSLNGSITFAPTTKYISFYITENLKHDGYLQWVVDSVKYYKSNGTETTSADAQLVKLKITSLNDFNELYGYATTTKYQFLDGDRVMFISGGLGDIYDNVANGGIVDLPINAKYNTDTPFVVSEGDILLDFDPRIGAISVGTLIQLTHQKTCAKKEIYYEIPCSRIDIVDGKPKETTKVLNAFDTYMRRRIIKQGDSAPTYSHLYESSSPSDTWGNGCIGKGRVNVKNEYAKKQWSTNEIARSDSWVNNGSVNGLATFRDSNVKNFKGQEYGGIIALHAERNIIHFICENDWFTTDYNMNYARVTENGLVAVSLENSISEPYQKVGMLYGCDYNDTMSIVYENGIVAWYDRSNSAFIISDYKSANDVALIDNKGWFVERTKKLVSINENEEIARVVCGYDPMYNEIIATFIVDETKNINNEFGINTSLNETFVFNLDFKKWVRFDHVTAENYGVLRGAKNGVLLFSFSNGEAYVHNNVNETNYNTFFGQEVDQVVEVVENEAYQKDKNFLAVAIESPEMAYEVDRVITNQPNVSSEIPIAYFEKRHTAWYAPILCDKNTIDNYEHTIVSMLVDGKRIFGNFVRLRFIRDKKKRTKYNEVSNFHVKFASIEQTAK
jgi:hypothetical protein